MKRMLDAQHQVSHAKAAAQRRRASDPNPLQRTSSMPSICHETPSRLQPGASFYAMSREDSRVLKKTAVRTLPLALAKTPEAAAPERPKVRLTKRRASV